MNAAQEMAIVAAVTLVAAVMIVSALIYFLFYFT